jgi:hypothetical protein
MDARDAATAVQAIKPVKFSSMDTLIPSVYAVKTDRTGALASS